MSFLVSIQVFTECFFCKTFPVQGSTRNTLTQASKNDRKPYLFPQKKFIRVFYAINIFNTIYYFKPTNFFVHKDNAFCKFYTFFGFVYHELKQKLK